MAKKTYAISVIGCQMNKSDAERIAGYLDNLGYIEADDKKHADLFVAVTCGIRQSAEDRVYGIIPAVKKENHDVKIVLAGCLSERADVKKRLQDSVDVWLPMTALETLQERLVGDQSSVHHFGKDGDYLRIKPKYVSRISAFVPIGNGCNNFCSYCVVPYARGREVYRPAADIIAEVENLVSNGYREITLIAQNVNSYVASAGKDSKGKINFTKLLKSVNSITGDFWLRFATSHPKDMSEELLSALPALDKLCPHLHLPAQSGDNEILWKMNRKYTKEHYLALLAKTKEALNKNAKNFCHENGGWQEPAALTTDIIVGFPGETRKQFMQTAALLKTVKFDMAYIAQYSPRAGTAAFKLDDNIPREEKKRREKILMDIIRKSSLVNNKKYLHQSVAVLVEGRKKDRMLYGKTRAGKVIKFIGKNGEETKEHELIGKIVNIRVSKVSDFGMEGTLISTTVR
jgi:tRNA-2-methylthio-N6-dimethylallyladenosine synthase